MESRGVKMEFIVRSTVSSLFRMLSTPNGLSQWMCDGAVQTGENSYVFRWSKSEMGASVISFKQDSYIKFQLEDDSQIFMEIDKTELTKEVALTITEWSDSDDEEDTRSIWEQNIKRLKLKLGSGR